MGEKGIIMIKQEILDKINAVDCDKEFLDRLAKSETPEEFQTVFQEKGVDLTLDEIEELIEKIADSDNKNGELDETDLSGVSGGVAFATILNAIFYAATKTWGPLLPRVKR